MKATVHPLLWACCAGWLLSGCLSAPPADYPLQPAVVNRQAEMRQALLSLLPPEQRAAAAEEAQWLTSTSFRAAAAIARYNNPRLKGWFNNMLVNSSHGYQERGLCWQYQHDLYRELRRRPLQFYCLGCGVMDEGKGSEHHCLSIAARGGAFPDVVIIDAWLNNGRLKLVDIETARDRHWTEEPKTVATLNYYYPEGHNVPMEHWLMVRKSGGMRDYVPFDSAEGKACPQGQLMRRRMQQGLRARGGKAFMY